MSCCYGMAVCHVAMVWQYVMLLWSGSMSCCYGVAVCHVAMELWSGSMSCCYGSCYGCHVAMEWQFVMLLWLLCVCVRVAYQIWKTAVSVFVKLLISQSFGF